MLDKKEPLKVPPGIRFLSEWSDFELPNYPCIIDKQITGCGFTEYVINGNFNSVLCSPRTNLLKNKVAQHNRKILGIDGSFVGEDINLYYAKSTIERDPGIDKDLEKQRADKEESIEIETIDIEKFKTDLNNAIDSFISHGKPIKICVTYDSFRKVKEVLLERGLLDTFYIIIDEFQSIFTDSRFKPDTEMEFVTHLQGIQRVSFVSATPMMEDYLNELEEFNSLPYIKLDWKTLDPGRLITPDLTVKSCRGINEVAKRYITDHRKGIFDKRTKFSLNGSPEEVVEARELVFYVNSIKNICEIIRQNKLMPEDVNIICADTSDNRKKIRESFRVVYREASRDIKELPSLGDVISQVPIPDPITGLVYNKPITLCSKTVYLGADFYSDCARSIILSDAGIESLAVDITLDLPQILGRQRLESNPWKNSAEIWVRYGVRSGEITQEQFEARLQEKIRRTESLLLSYESSPTSNSKHDLADKYLSALKSENYRNDYVAVNKHSGSDLKPQMNKLVMISEKRAYEIQRVDYKNRFNVVKAVINQFGLNSINADLQLFIESIESSKFFTGKFRAICKYIEDSPLELKETLLLHMPEPFKTYYFTLGPDFLSSVSYSKSKIEEAMNLKLNSGTKIYTKEEISEYIKSSFEVGDRKSKSEWKQVLEDLYKTIGISKKAKASDLEEWFVIKRISIATLDGKRSDGFELISLR